MITEDEYKKALQNRIVILNAVKDLHKKSNNPLREILRQAQNDRFTWFCKAFYKSHRFLIFHPSLPIENET